MFTAPNQVVGHIESYSDNEGLSLFIHPDFVQGYPLAAKIKQFGFFSYASNEALHLSEQERSTLLAIYNIIREDTGLTISQVAYELGFEHPQSFSRLFKMKTKISPAEFRSTFN
jgi:AraC family transcriptional activator of pobA